MTAMIKDTSGQDIYLAPAPLRKRLGLWGSAGILLLLAVSLLIWKFSAVMAADRVLNRSDLRLAQVERGDLIREVSAQGRVIAANSPTLFAQESGTIDLLVKAGDSVTKKQIIARILSPDLEEQLVQQQANLKRLQTQLDGARITSKRQKLDLLQRESIAQVNLTAMEREKRRAEAAYKLKVISTFDYEEAIDNLARAELEYEQAKQNNSLAQESLEFSVRASQLEIESQQSVVGALERRVNALDIRSPVDGMIGSVQIENRQAVTANQPLITVVDLQAFELEARISEGYADDLVPGLPAKIQLGTHTYTAELTAISPEVTQSEVAIRIKFVGDQPLNLRQNQRLSARILLENIENTLKVSSGSYFDNFRGDVFKVVGENAEKVPVSVGSRNLREIEILSGLQEGDTIIISTLNYTGSDQHFFINH